MALEIERKFLVRGSSMLDGLEGIRMVQGYAPSPTATLRIRIAGSKAFLTVKGTSKGITRTEFEYPIPVADAEALLPLLCQGARVEKTRYRIDHGDHTWEVDVFHGANEGLVLAEVELEDESEQVELPDWAGDEVSHDARYYSSNLARNPFQRWGKPESVK